MPNGDDNGGGKSLNEAASDEAGRLFTWVLVAFLVIRVIDQLPEMWENITESASFGVLSTVWSWFFNIYVFLAILLSMFFVWGIIHAVRNTSQIRVQEKQKREDEIGEALSDPPGPQNPRWQHVEDLASSDSERDWRLAIIEADIMLDEMMRILGYEQESLGDKLHAASQSDFRTIDMAWEAHKLRNQIAHEGSAYRLTRREAQQTIDLYRQVFDEFSYL